MNDNNESTILAHRNIGGREPPGVDMLLRIYVRYSW